MFPDSLFGFFISSMFTMVPLFMFGVMGFMVYTLVSRNRYNRSQPRLTVEAKVVAKRNNVSHGGMNDNMHHSSSYYVTFEVESGDRFELQMPGSEFGLLAEGDLGKLTFQGHAYLNFQRSN